MKIVVFGMGYVGCVSAACLANMGYRVVGVDKDELKVRSISEGRAPFFEPGLDELVRDTVARGLLSATCDEAAALEGADIAFVCVGTPSEHNGNLDLDQLKRVCKRIAAVLEPEQRLILVIRSTVFPGTCEQVVSPAFDNRPCVTIVSNPEFLREGCALKDFIDPSLIVVGGMDAGSVRAVAAVYKALGVEPCLVSLRTAELIKYACNAFHASKIAFANEVGALSATLGVDAQEVMGTLCRDQRLNISAAYLKPGFAFGGSCLPKDLRALSYRATRLDLNLPFLESVLESNQAHLQRAIRRVMGSEASRIGVFGLAFKENTDDLRESPVVTLLEHLIGKGRNVRVFDPHIQLDSIYGSNRNFILNAIPHISHLLTPDLESLLSWSDAIVLTQTPPAAFLADIEASGLPVMNLSKETLLEDRMATEGELNLA